MFNYTSAMADVVAVLCGPSWDDNSDERTGFCMACDDHTVYNYDADADAWVCVTCESVA